MIDAELSITTSGGRRSFTLASCLNGAAEEQAQTEAYAWIKALRHLEVDGQPFRERFMARGDSLWWFSELYLHKTQAILNIHRWIAALDTLIDRERPLTLTVVRGPVALEHVAAQCAASRGIGTNSPVRGSAWWRRLVTLDLQARRLALFARAAPDRFRSAPVVQVPAVAAFVHRAFWRAGGEAGSAESYIGPVLHELEQRLGAGKVRYVGVGPATNFRQRRRWGTSDPPSTAVVPVERYASGRALDTSRMVWRSRYRHFSRLTSSAAFRDAARISGVDCWPIVREQLAGIAWLQWPWSVRAMDEAGAALDALGPRSVVTYAEAGGWGRALVLEARRRQIPSVGLQHGFIYRHWLNYLHEPDEMAEDEHSGFPRPTKTLLFDEFAARHLRERGRFPPHAIGVTGSPGRDALLGAVKRLQEPEIEAARRAAGLQPSDILVLVTTKEREARPFLSGLVEAARSVAGAVLVIKPHPAETASAYGPVSAGHSHVRVLPPDAALAPLLAAARAVVTVNSTVAVDAGVLGIPALTVGLPNNLSPFVEAGAMAGVEGTAGLEDRLRRILYDEGFRQQLSVQRRIILGVGSTGRDDGAARRTADAVCELLVPATGSAAR